MPIHFLQVSKKKLSDKNSLGFTSIYGQNKRGKNSPNTQEVTNLEGERYNSYWGYQGGEKKKLQSKNSWRTYFYVNRLLEDNIKNRSYH